MPATLIKSAHRTMASHHLSLTLSPQSPQPTSASASATQTLSSTQDAAQQTEQALSVPFRLRKLEAEMPQLIQAAQAYFAKVKEVNSYNNMFFTFDRLLANLMQQVELVKGENEKLMVYGANAAVLAELKEAKKIKEKVEAENARLVEMNKGLKEEIEVDKFLADLQGATKMENTQLKDRNEALVQEKQQLKARVAELEVERRQHLDSIEAQRKKNGKLQHGNNFVNSRNSELVVQQTKHENMLKRQGAKVEQLAVENKKLREMNLNLVKEKQKSVKDLEHAEEKIGRDVVEKWVAMAVGVVKEKSGEPEALQEEVEVPEEVQMERVPGIWSNLMMSYGWLLPRSYRR